MIVTAHCPDQQTLSRLRNRADSPHELRWPNVVVYGNYTHLEKIIHESAFTIFSLTGVGQGKVKTKGQNLRFFRDTLCIFNPFESFEYRIKESHEVTILNLHLQLDTYYTLLHDILSSDDALLNNPDVQSVDYSFYHHIHFNKPIFREKLLMFDRLPEDEYLLEVRDILTQLILDSKLSLQGLALNKKSTKNELLRRVGIGRDIIFSEYNDPNLTIDKLAREVSMSKYHFIRIFKDAFGFTPHKLIQQIRIRKAMEFVREGKMTRSAIAFKVGFQETNSLYPLIRGYKIK